MTAFTYDRLTMVDSHERRGSAGMSINDYRLLRQVGAGPDGVAYDARHLVDDEPVEFVRLETSSVEPEHWSDLKRRLAVVAGTNHPAIRALRELGLDHDPAFVVLAPVSSSTLEDVLGGRNGYQLSLGLQFVRDLAGALAESHRLGLAHGRLGPGTVFVDQHGRPCIDLTGLDVGGDVPVTARKTAAEFVAPEGGGSFEADVFSLGWLATRLLSGQLAGLPGGGRSDLDALLRDMTLRDPEDRPSASEAATRLAILLRSFVDAATQADTGAGSGSDEVTGEFVTADQRPTLTSRQGTQDLAMAVAPTIPERLGRYRIVEKLGSGGMGEVYKAVDEADGSVVAVKVLRPDYSDRPNALKRFRKEARLLARVRNPYVTNLLDVNEDRGLHYLVIEYVEGESLDRVLMRRDRLDEPTALSLASDVARGLMDAHRLGIVHRDIKPANILITRVEVGSREGLKAKLSDFGLARVAVGEESQVLTQAGMVVGTPAYMAPEQCSGAQVDVRADIYALGATLFHLVTGRPPFEAEDWRGVIARHMNEAPPSLSRLNPAVSEGLTQVVERSLAKLPEDRYGDAEALLDALERVARGEPTGLTLHPSLPAADDPNVLCFDFRWDLESPPRRLWPYVANTDRVDRALGFGAVTYVLRKDPTLGMRRFLEGRKAGQVEAGEEQPYEWVEGRRLGVVREYSKGPFVSVVSVVELAARPNGGTRLSHRLRVEPRTRLIRIGSRWGIGSRLKRDLERVYRRIDSVLTGKHGAGPAVDPFEAAPELDEAANQRLEEGVAAILKHGVEPSVAEALRRFIAEAPAPELARIRPLALARRLGVDESAFAEACLRGANAGLLVLLWDLLCPVCRIASEVKDSLRSLADHGHCEVCQKEYVLDFASSVELVFRSHAQVREADTKTYCAAGPAHSPHVVAQMRLAAGERLELELSLGEGSYRLIGPQLTWRVDFRVRQGETVRRWDIDLAAQEPDGAGRSFGTGNQFLVITNTFDRPLVVRVERMAPRDDALTAARASSLALFRELFPGEILSPGRLVSIAAVTLLLTDLEPGARGLYEEIGEAQAFALLQELFAHLSAVTGRHGGAVVKSVGEGVVASFPDPGSAVAAVVELARSLPESLAGLEPRRRLKFVVHRGPAFATTVNDHLDYFGATVFDARRILAHSEAGAAYLTSPVAGDPQVARELEGRGVKSGEVLGEAILPHIGPLLRLPLDALAADPSRMPFNGSKPVAAERASAF